MTCSDTCRTENNQEKNRISKFAGQRLKWMEFFDKHKNARMTCRHFGISPDTFYLWKKRYNPSNLKTLEDNFQTRRPHRVRASRHKKIYSDIVSKLKSSHPHMGKHRLTKILKNTGFEISASTVGRILKDGARNDEC